MIYYRVIKPSWCIHSGNPALFIFTEKRNINDAYRERASISKIYQDGGGKGCRGCEMIVKEIEK